MFTIDLDTPIVAECRLDAASLRMAWFMATSEHISMRKALDAVIYQDEITTMIDTVRTRYPKDYSGAALSYKGSSSWIGCRGAVPAGARRLIADFRALPIMARTAE